MRIKRRDFFKMAASGAAALTLSPPVPSFSSELPVNAVGLLYDATLCVGCQTCLYACKEANNMPLEHNGPLKLWDNPIDLSAKTLNIIKKYENGTKAVKDREVDGYSFIKRQCMHCVDPACVSACPASAMTKDKKTGIVKYNKDACIGCRYCQVACQFNVPKFQWDEPFPQIVKCQMCSHLVQKGKIPACSNVCPTGATLFGPSEDLLREARRRLHLVTGNYYEFPLNSLSSGRTTMHKAAKYINHIYGEKESGGTQVMLLSGVSFGNLGLPDLPDRSYTSIAEHIQHTLYQGMILPVVAFAGLVYLVSRNKSKDE